MSELFEYFSKEVTVTLTDIDDIERYDNRCPYDKQKCLGRRCMAWVDSKDVENSGYCRRIFR